MGTMRVQTNFQSSFIYGQQTDKERIDDPPIYSIQLARVGENTNNSGEFAASLCYSKIFNCENFCILVIYDQVVDF